MKRDVKKYYGVSKKKRIANITIAILLLLAAAVVLISIYGQNVGNFVIAVDTNIQASLSLAEEPKFANPTARLAAKGTEDQTHATYADIPKDIMNREGSNNDEESKRYFAYSFYIMNTSSITFDYNVEIVIKESTRGVESAIRVMVIEDDGKEVKQTIYAKAKEWPESEAGKPEDHLGTSIEENYETVPFLSLTTVMQLSEKDFVKGATKKYTVVMWLEGWDRECTDDIKGGIIRMEMRFGTAKA